MAGRIGRALNNIKDAVVASAKGLSLRDPVQAWLAGLGWEGDRKHVSAPYRRAPYVYAAVSGIAEALASVEVQVQTLDNKPVDSRDDPSVRLLHQPNALQDRTSFFEATLSFLQLDGQVFWVTLDALGRMNEYEHAIHVAQDGEMRPETVDGRLVGWNYRPGSAAETFLPLDQVCRHYFVDPANPLKGTPIARAAQLSIDQHVFASEYNASAFQNGADPGSVYETDARLTPEQKKQIEDDIRENHGGTANVKKPMVLWGGLKWKPGVQSLKDMDFIEGKKLTRDETLTVFKVPPVIAGIYEHATLNNSKEQVLLFWDHRGIPLLRRVLRAWNGFVQRQIASDKELVPILSSVQALKEREIETTAGVLKFQEQGLPLNHLIDVFDLPFEHQPWGDEPLVAAGQIPISVAFADAKELLEGDRKPEGGEEENVETPKRTGVEMEAIRAGFDADLNGFQSAVEQHAKTDADARKRRAIHQRWFASYAGLRRVGRLRFRSFVLRQRDETLRRLRKTGLPEKGTEGRSDGGTKRKSSIDQWLAEVLFDLKVEGNRITALSRVLFAEGAKLGGEQALQEGQAPKDQRFRLHDPAVRRRLERQAIRVQRVNKTTHTVIRRALLKGLDEGETLSEISERVAKAMNVRANRQSYRIAETEMHEAMAAGRHEGFRQAGVEAQAWLTSGRGVEPAGPTRKTHWGTEQATKAKPVPMGEQFTVGGHKCDHPGDGRLPPGERIHCSCMTVARRLTGGKAVTLDEYLNVKFLTYGELCEGRSKAA